jgi:C4-dicarboxylate-specific signal transduction histidine kinase
MVQDGNIISLLCANVSGDSDCDISKSLNLNEVISREVSLPSGRSFALSIYPVAESGGTRNSQAAVYVHETTQQKRMLAHMTQAEKLATVGKLASGLAHEINNPLGVILCYAKLLKKGLPEGQTGEDIDVIVKHTRQAQSVLTNLLSFARPKVGNDGTVSLPEIIDSLVKVFRVQAENQHAVLSAGTAGEIPPVPVDNQALEHIMANLIINALDAVPDKDGRIDIRTAYDDLAEEVVVTVCDNGPGIAEKDHKFIFDPFYTTKEVNKGSGLGLSIVFGFMSDLGGSVMADNQNTGGARFTLRFPVAGTEAI